MNILPNKSEEFRDKEYWESFFKKRRQKAFEWYGSYGDLCSILHKYIKTTDNILVVGCGNSKLSGDMYQVGLRKLTNIDISEVAIKNMSKQYSSVAPEMRWLHMDATNMEFGKEEFTVVLDKGTLDALMTDESESVVENVEKMFNEIERVLKFSGRFICVSLLQEHILRKILHWFLDRGWFVRVCRRAEAGVLDSGDESAGLHFPVFVVVCTKLKPMGAAMKTNTFLEIAVNDGDAARKTSLEEVMTSVRDLQRVAFIQSKLSSCSVSGENVSFNLFNETNEHPRYTLYVVDSSTKLPNKFAIFIVPNGRETEWLFGSAKGREKLGEMTECQRLVIAHLNRNHSYENLEVIKKELSKKVMSLAPKDYNTNMMVQFLSVGDDVGKRDVLHRCCSEINGEFVVEDVEGEDKKMFRRLIFLNSASSIQSDALLVKRKNKRHKSHVMVVDVTQLTCQYLFFMAAGFSFLPPQKLVKGSRLRVLLIGLGGGSLPMFLHHALADAVLTVIELDPCIVNAARHYFGFTTDDRMTVHVADGLQYIASCQEDAFDVLLVDVDNKDLSEGMSFPPPQFLSATALAEFQRILTPTGVLSLNLACRDEQLKEELISGVSAAFGVGGGGCLSRSVPGDVNEIVYGVRAPQPLKVVKENMDALNKSFGDFEQLKTHSAINAG